MITYSLNFCGVPLPTAVLIVERVVIRNEPDTPSGMKVVVTYNVFANEVAYLNGDAPIKSEMCSFMDPVPTNTKRHRVDIEKIRGKSNKLFKQGGNIFLAIEHGLLEITEFQGGTIS